MMRAFWNARFVVVMMHIVIFVIAEKSILSSAGYAVAIPESS
jgi:hypothetical protein